MGSSSFSLSVADEDIQTDKLRGRSFEETGEGGGHQDESRAATPTHPPQRLPDRPPLSKLSLGGAPEATKRGGSAKREQHPKVVLVVVVVGKPMRLGAHSDVRGGDPGI